MVSPSQLKSKKKVALLIPKSKIIQNIGKGESILDSTVKLVGVIGGLSHESSDGYSKGIHEIVNRALGGLNNAELIQYDVNFAEIREDMLAGDWEGIGSYLAGVAETLTYVGAQYVAVASNTIHKVAPEIEARIGADRFIHIADCIGQRCVAEIEQNRTRCPEFYNADDPKKVLLLGTRETMTGSFLRERLEKYGLIIETPDEVSMRMLDDRIFNELCHGEVGEEIQKWYLHMVQDTLNGQPVDAIVLGCTELSLIYDEFNLAHRVDMLQANGHRPFAVVDSKQTHIMGIAEACLGQWKGSD